MKFKVNVEQFSKALRPVVNIATRNTEKDFQNANHLQLESELKIFNYNKQKSLYRIFHSNLLSGII